jgi:hypothetical protein
MPKVLNQNKDTIPPDAVYIGRPSKFGNPFPISGVVTRHRAIKKYEQWLKQQPALLQQVRDELRGRDLVCFCSPKPCHGDVLLKLANQPSIFEEKK